VEEEKGRHSKLSSKRRESAVADKPQRYMQKSKYRENEKIKEKRHVVQIINK